MCSHPSRLKLLRQQIGYHLFPSMSATSIKSEETQELRVRRSQARSRSEPRTSLTITISSDSGSDDGKSKAKNSSNKGDSKARQQRQKAMSPYDGCKNTAHGKDCKGYMPSCTLDFVTADFEEWRAYVRNRMDQAKAQAKSAVSSAIEDRQPEADSMAAQASSSACDETQPESDHESQFA